MKLTVLDDQYLKGLINEKNLSHTLKTSLFKELDSLDLSSKEINDLKKWLVVQLAKPKISSRFRIDKFKDRPRYLSDEEINEILKVVPEVYAATKEAATKIQDEIKRTFFLHIKNLPIAPSKINDLKKHIINQFVRSRIEPGEAVGLKTGEANGQPMMQLTLNSFHQAGSATANQSGIDTYKELINVTKLRKNTYTTMHFKNKNYTFDEIVKIKNEFIGVTINDLYKDSIRSKEIRQSTNIQDWWYNYHTLIFGELHEDFHSQQYLRLHLDTQKLYNYSISLEQLVTAIEKIKMETYFVAKCIYSQNNIGIIDIYINKVLSSTNSHIYKNKDNIAKKNLFLVLSLLLNQNKIPKIETLKFLISKGVDPNLVVKEDDKEGYNIINKYSRTSFHYLLLNILFYLILIYVNHDILVLLFQYILIEKY